MKRIFTLGFAWVLGSESKNVWSMSDVHCPAHVRFVHGQMFKDSPIDIRVNGQTLAKQLEFRKLTEYLPLADGPSKIEIVDSKTQAVLEERDIILGSNLGYTVAFLGPTPSPEGTRFGDRNPFVFIDDIVPVANSKRWKGTWYRFSETNAVIDLRISAGDNFEKEVLRLKRKENKATYNLGDNPEGFYQFHPVLIGKSDPLLNTALEPPAIVQIAPTNIPGGVNFDVLALGNALGQGPNSLQLTSQMYRPELGADGCLKIETIK